MFVAILEICADILGITILGGGGGEDTKVSLFMTLTEILGEKGEILGEAGNIL